MKERPILFSAEMVRAILSSAKTQTRRVVKGVPDHVGCVRVTSSWSRPSDPSHAHFFEGGTPESRGLASVKCPYGRPGDRLWVREAWRPYQWPGEDDAWRVEYRSGGPISGLVYPPDAPQTDALAIRATEEYQTREHVAWRPSIHMPRWASRILLEITDVRVERVQDISEEDAVAEGVHPGFLRRKDTGETLLGRARFIHLWESINGKRGYGWRENPWVWVVSFRMIDGGAA